LVHGTKGSDAVPTYWLHYSNSHRILLYESKLCHATKIEGLIELFHTNNQSTKPLLILKRTTFEYNLFLIGPLVELTLINQAFLTVYPEWVNFQKRPLL
jgi:hypothetical protein